MGRRLYQPSLPLLDEAGTHRRECECPRCDAGFRPGERERALAARRWQEQQERRAAEAALERKRARDRAKAMKTALLLEEQERKTTALLAAEAEVRRRLKADHRLEAMLASRREGRSIDEALGDADAGTGTDA
jgi:hypothetical protein